MAVVLTSLSYSGSLLRFEEVDKLCSHSVKFIFRALVGILGLNGLTLSCFSSETAPRSGHYYLDRSQFRHCDFDKRL